MNIWNPTAPGAINLTDNQIYETCSDLLDGENHYCTPVPSRQTSGVLPAIPPRSTSGETSRNRPTVKCAGVCVAFLLLLVLSVVAIACGGYAVQQIQRLQEEVGTLRGEIGVIRQELRGGAANLNESLFSEVRDRNARLAELESRMQFALNGLEQQVAVNFSLLMTDVQTGFSFLSADVEKNLTLLANISSLDLVELANNVRMNVTMVANELEYLENQTEMRLSNLQSTIYLNISSLEANTGEDLQQLANLTEKILDSLNSTFVEELHRVDTELCTLERSTYLNITQLSANHKRDVEHISSGISLLNTKVSDLTSTTSERSNELQAVISSLSEEAYRNISSLENATTNSITLLSDELARVEIELALEAHGNISQLNLDLRDRLNDVSTTFQERVADLEEETESTFTSINNRTDTRFANLESELQSNLTSLRLSTAQDVAALDNQTLNHLERIEDSFREDLGILSGETYRNLTTLSTITEQRITELDDDTASSLTDLRAAESETRVLLNQTMLETARNFTESRQELEQDILQLRSEIQASFEELNLSDSEILNGLRTLDARINNTSGELNRTEEMLLLLISSETSSLRISLARVGDDVLNVTNQIQNITHLLQAGFNSTDASLLDLQRSHDLLAMESSENITRIMDTTEALRTDLEELAESTRRNISDSATALRTDVQSMLDETMTNLTQLENRITENLDLLNSSLHLEIFDVSLVANSSIENLSANVSNAVLGVYSYINNSIDEIGIRLEVLHATVLGIKVTLNSTGMDVVTLQDQTDDISELVVDLKANVTVMNIELAQNVARAIQEINSNFDYVRDGLFSLEMDTRTNLTEVENGLSYQLQRVENETRSDIASARRETELGIENLRFAAYSNITNSSTALTQALHELNISLLNSLELSVMENVGSLNQVVHFTETNLSLLRSELSFVASNISELKDQAENFRDQQASTSVSINSLNSSIHDLGLKLDATRGNVSEVTNEVELLDGRVRTHLNSTVDLFGGCMEEVSNCSYSPSNTDYQDVCTTPALDINITVSEL